ncbi:MAG: DUF421 domain-containing protein [Bacteroidales bacterium]
MTLPFVVTHTLVIYVFLVVALATLGRQQMGQLTLADYLIIALLGSAVKTGLYVGGGSFWAGVVSAFTLLASNRAFRFVSAHVPRVRRFIVGSPILVVHGGRVLDRNLRRAHMTEQDLMSAIRIRGYDSLEAVRFAVVEPNGSVGVVPRDAEEHGAQSDS